MTQKVLGLDLGTNSIGSAVRNLDLSDDLQWQLEFFSSDIFRSSVNKESNGREYSLAAQRSAHRRSRGLNEVRRRRLWATLNLLIKHGFCPMSSESLMRWCTYDKRKGLLESIQLMIRISMHGYFWTLTAMADQIIPVHTNCVENL